MAAAQRIRKAVRLGGEISAAWRSWRRNAIGAASVGGEKVNKRSGIAAAGENQPAVAYGETTLAMAAKTSAGGTAWRKAAAKMRSGGGENWRRKPWLISGNRLSVNNQ